MLARAKAILAILSKPDDLTCSHPKANTSLQLEVESMNKPT